jgi:hypothetical protein
LGTYLELDYCEVYDCLMKSTVMFLTADKVKVTVLWPFRSYLIKYMEDEKVAKMVKPHWSLEATMEKKMTRKE